MKLMTINQLKFAGLLIILTIAFHVGLSSLLRSALFSWVWFIGLLYAILAFIAGWIFGRRDYASLPLYSIGFRFHATTYIVCNSIAEMYYFFGFQSQFESGEYVHMTAIFWGIGLLIHFILFLIFRKNAIKGIEKTEIFE